MTAREQVIAERAVEGGTDRVVQLGDRYFLVELRLDADLADVSELTEAEARDLALSWGTPDLVVA